ncbi:MAG: FadR family transcriptional regulator [Treponema sp.]|jgi:GntR family transcriptional repressor for pyruvate dehydrogenase complex|nr:FadR family transcriptional regulator [Treponema sp.]
MKTKKQTFWDIKDGGIQHQNLYEQIADSLEEMILNDGTNSKRLPSEYDLVEKYRVSRSVVREALKALKERGLVSMRAGDGSYVTIPKSETISRAVGRVTRFNGISDEKITRVRSSLESSSAADAARYATGEDIAELESIVEQMEHYGGDVQNRVESDYAFHLAVARISRNELLVFMIESIVGLLKGYIKERLERSPGGHEDGILWHRRIIGAIRAHNSRLARKYMQQHLEASFHQLD